MVENRVEEKALGFAKDGLLEARGEAICHLGMSAIRRNREKKVDLHLILEREGKGVAISTSGLSFPYRDLLKERGMNWDSTRKCWICRFEGKTLKESARQALEKAVEICEALWEAGNKPDEE